MLLEDSHCLLTWSLNIEDGSQVSVQARIFQLNVKRIFCNTVLNVAFHLINSIRSNFI